MRPELYPFYVFGMGDRPKLLFRDGLLREALTGKPVRDWSGRPFTVMPARYRVEIDLAGDARAAIYEDSDGLWLDEGHGPQRLGSGGVALPDFRGHPHARALRVLLQEVLVNVMNGMPLPNLFVYNRPWYRDAAMIAMVLERTGNLHLISDWVERLREPFDQNNAGEEEPDNLGQALYLISLFSDARHPAVETVLSAARRFEEGDHIVGLSDGAPRPVYQTRWMKFGLKRLGLEDAYVVPEAEDTYADLFWWDSSGPDALATEDAKEPEADWLYPYLTWARAHFRGTRPPTELLGESYPLTWEGRASQAGYAGAAWAHPGYARDRLAAPHSWHAAEAFLYLLELDSRA